MERKKLKKVEQTHDRSEGIIQEEKKIVYNGNFLNCVDASEKC